MTWSVELEPAAAKFIGKLDEHLRKRIEERLWRLGDDPVPSDAKFLGRDPAGEKFYRYRIRDYRALYRLKDSEQLVHVATIDKRPRVYQ